MDIITLPFEEPLILNVHGELVHIVAFRTPEHGNIKFGVQASRAVQIHREEIYQAIKSKEETNSI